MVLGASGRTGAPHSQMKRFAFVQPHGQRREGVGLAGLCSRHFGIFYAFDENHHTVVEVWLLYVRTAVEGFGSTGASGPSRCSRGKCRPQNTEETDRSIDRAVSATKPLLTHAIHPPIRRESTAHSDTRTTFEVGTGARRADLMQDTACVGSACESKKCAEGDDDPLRAGGLKLNSCSNEGRTRLNNSLAFALAHNSSNTAELARGVFESVAARRQHRKICQSQTYSIERARRPSHATCTFYPTSSALAGYQHPLVLQLVAPGRASFIYRPADRKKSPKIRIAQKKLPCF